MHFLAQRPEWREDALVARYVEEIEPQLDQRELALAPLLMPAAEHFVPARLQRLLHAPG